MIIKQMNVHSLTDHHSNIPKEAYTMQPNPGRGISRLLFLIGLANLPFLFIFGDSTSHIIAWVCVGITALSVVCYIIIRVAGTERDHEDFPPPSQLGRQLAGDLKPVGQYIAATWHNLGGW